MATSKAVLSSLTHLRPLTCAASASSYPARLVPHPPDLIKWVTREGGFVHPAVKIAYHHSIGLGLVANEQIPKGTDLIILPHHLPLRFGSFESDPQDTIDSVLLQLARQVPDVLAEKGFHDHMFHLGGFVHPAVKIAYHHSIGLGLVANEQIPKGTDLIILPHHLPLRFGSFESDPQDTIDSVLLQLARQVPEELWAMKLGLKLLQERAKVGSFWWPYISNLPETYSVPIFFPGEDIKNLQYAPLLHQVNKRCRFLLDFEREVTHTLVNLTPDKHPFGGQEVNASSLGWAMSAVSSRAFRLYGNKRPDGVHIDVPMMLPLIDMCNHSFSPNARIVQEQDTGNMKIQVKVMAEIAIKEDDPLLLSYGCLSNDLFLLDYGFVEKSNPYDCIELKYDGALLDAASMAAGVSSPNFSAPAPWQELILSQLNLVGEAPDLKVSLGGQEIVEGRLLAALRVLVASNMETAQNYDLNTLKSLSAEAPLGVANDIAVFRTLIALCVIALGHFPTKIMDDESLLKQGASGLTELAIQFRIQKKSVIVDVMRNLSRRVKLLSSKETVTAEG